MRPDESREKEKTQLPTRTDLAAFSDHSAAPAGLTRLRPIGYTPSHQPRMTTSGRTAEETPECRRIGALISSRSFRFCLHEFIGPRKWTAHLLSTSSRVETMESNSVRPRRFFGTDDQTKDGAVGGGTQPVQG